MSQPAAAEAPSIAMVPLEQIEPAPFNPRKTFLEIDELAEDLKRRGVLQPVLLRPHNGKYQLVFGERRWRAAKKAKLGAVPAMIRPMTDVEALETAIIENSKRVDVHPLEEADAFEELIHKHGLSLEDVAAKVAKSASYVRARLRFVALGKETREAFLQGKLTTTTALMVVTRVPPAKQAEATKKIIEALEIGRSSTRDISWLLQREYMLNLDGAPFDTKDANLLPSAGACSTCPKRTGNNPELFGDVDRTDVCSDADCFKAKVKLTTDRVLAHAEKAGAKVLEKKEADKALGYGSGFVRLEEPCWQDPKGRPWAQVLKKVDVERVVAVSAAGAAHELVDQKKALAALKDTGVEWAKRSAAPGRAATADDKKRLLEQKVEARAKARAMEIVVENVEESAEAIEVRLWEILLEAQLRHGWGETTKDVARRRGLMKDGNQEDAKKAITAAAKEMDLQQLRALVFELNITREGYYGERTKTLLELAGAHFDIDMKELKRQARAELKPKGKKA